MYMRESNKFRLSKELHHQKTYKKLQKIRQIYFGRALLHVKSCEPMWKLHVVKFMYGGSEFRPLWGDSTIKKLDI